MRCSACDELPTTNFSYILLSAEARNPYLLTGTKKRLNFMMFSHRQIFIKQLPREDCKPNAIDVFDRDVEGSFFLRLTPPRVNCSATEVFGGLRDSKDTVEEEARQEKVSSASFQTSCIYLSSFEEFSF